jgi:DNA-binding response OmpR family regulator
MSSPHRYPPRHLLVLDLDEKLLLTLQQVLEDAGFDTTITWDENEARHLVGRMRYDLIVVGEHPPELVADRVLRDFAQQGSPPPCLILGRKSLEPALQHLREIEVIGVIPKPEPLRVLEQVRKHLILPTIRPPLAAS